MLITIHYEWRLLVHRPIYVEWEIKITEIYVKNGVMIAPGHVYMAEEFGWFRTTFTVGEEALKEGLNPRR